MAGMGTLRLRDPGHAVVTVSQDLYPQAVVLLWHGRDSITPKTEQKTVQGQKILTSASRSKRPKSSLRVRTRTWADRFMDNRVKPLMSAKRMLQKPGE